ncbi:MAG: hypothetical protein HQ474_05860 [Flammeovirgaceae bacterium]|nr:hypothetical protein [Flammeovirgaceae bacterium]
MQYKKQIVWTLIILSMVMFWVSLRSTHDQLTYTFIAFGIWIVSYLINKFIS